MNWKMTITRQPRTTSPIQGIHGDDFSGEKFGVLKEKEIKQYGVPSAPFGGG